MVRPLLQGLLLLWLPLNLPAAELRLELESHQLELGQPLEATLHYRGEHPPADAQLAPLRQDFSVQDIYLHQTTEPQEHTLAFTLYPRRSGRLTLPVLEHAGLKTTAQTLNVRPAHAGGETVTVSGSVSTTRPWVRQQVLLQLEVFTTDRFASLSIEPPELPGLTLIPLQAERERVDTPRGERTRLRIGLALFPLVAGSQQLRLPPVHYRLDGGTRLRLPLPEPRLEVKPLPIYLPPTLPVGRLQFDSRLETTGLLSTDEPGLWQIRLRAEGIPPQWLPSLRQQLIADEVLRLLPPQSDTTLHADHTGIWVERSLEVPFAAGSSGIHRLPWLTLDYFDPHSGRLERAEHRPAQPWVVSLPLRLGLAALLLALLAWRGPPLWRGMQRRRRQCRLAGEARQQLATASDSAAIRRALRHYAAALGGTGNLSLHQWQQQFGDEATEPLLQRLSDISYRGERQKTEDLRQALQQALHRRLPWYCRVCGRRHTGS